MFESHDYTVNYVSNKNDKGSIANIKIKGIPNPSREDKNLSPCNTDDMLKIESESSINYNQATKEHQNSSNYECKYSSHSIVADVMFVALFDTQISAKLFQIKTNTYNPFAKTPFISYTSSQREKSYINYRAIEDPLKDTVSPHSKHRLNFTNRSVTFINY